MRTQKKLKIFKNNKKSCLFKFRYQCYNHGLPITLFCENCDEPICKNCSEVVSFLTLLSNTFPRIFSKVRFQEINNITRKSISF